jgi:hypothetical protein
MRNLYKPMEYTCKLRLYTYRVAQKSVNLKYSLVLSGMFRFKLVSKCAERHHRAVRCALNVRAHLKHFV